MVPSEPYLLHSGDVALKFFGPGKTYRRLEADTPLVERKGVTEEPAFRINWTYDGQLLHHWKNHAPYGWYRAEPLAIAHRWS
jgi:hypothetical protein